MGVEKAKPPACGKPGSITMGFTYRAQTASLTHNPVAAPLVNTKGAGRHNPTRSTPATGTPMHGAVVVNPNEALPMLGAPLHEATGIPHGVE